MKRFFLLTAYAAILISVFAWNTQEKYLSGTGILFHIKTHGLDWIATAGIAFALAVAIAVAVVARRRP